MVKTLRLQDQDIKRIVLGQQNFILNTGEYPFIGLHTSFPNVYYHYIINTKQNSTIYTFLCFKY